MLFFWEKVCRLTNNSRSNGTCGKSQRQTALSEISLKTLLGMKRVANVPRPIMNGKLLSQNRARFLNVLFCSDFNYVRVNGVCEPMGPEPIPAGVCEDMSGTYQGSSGYRLIPGNTCKGGKKLDGPVTKECSKGIVGFRLEVNEELKCAVAQLPEGEVSHQTVCHYRCVLFVHDPDDWLSSPSQLGSCSMSTSRTHR